MRIMERGGCGSSTSRAGRAARGGGVHLLRPRIGYSLSSPSSSSSSIFVVTVVSVISRSLALLATTTTRQNMAWTSTTTTTMSTSRASRPPSPPIWTCRNRGEELLGVTGPAWWLSTTPSSRQRKAAATAIAATKVPAESLTVTDGSGSGSSASSPQASSQAPVVDGDDDESNAAAAVLAQLKSPFLQTLRDRGFLHQCTSWTELDDRLCGSNQQGDDEENGKEQAIVRAYLGFDATADSLHVGSLLQIMILRWFQKLGHQPIVLLGGGTSKVGDPTGKDESRVLLNDETIQTNIDGISQVFAKFLTLANPKEYDNNDSTDAIIVNNNDWLSQLSYLEFLRDYGTHFTINRMLSFESVKQRLAREAPFSFLEFNYMILQAYDFLELHRRYRVVLQLGGSDQWGNMIAGVELGRRVDGASLFALTAPLLTTSDGRKMGKTASGAVWLNADRLSPFEYWQFWRNTNDQDVIKFLKLFTELPIEDIDEMSLWTGSDLNKAKIVLADRATEMLHGSEVLPMIHETVQQMFSTTTSSSSAGAANMKTEGLVRVQVTKERLDDGIRIADLLAELKLASSKKEARRLIAGGGCRMSTAGGGSDEVKIEDETATLTLEEFAGSATVVLRAGKKRAGVVELVD